MGIIIFLGLSAISVYLFVSAAAACIRRARDRKNGVVETDLGEMEVPLVYPLKSRLIGDGPLLIFRDGNGTEKTIPITSVQSVQIEEIKSRRVGVIKLTIPKSPTGGFTIGGMMATVGNGEEAFSFGDEYMKQGQALYNHIQATLSSQGNVPADAPPALTDELLKLKSLLDSGTLTQEEFQQAKQRLLE